MRRRVVYWSLYHRDEKNQIDDLRTDQVEAVWAAIPVSHRSGWLIWREGFKTWKPFEEFPIMLEDLRKTDVSRGFQPPVPPTKAIEDQEREIESLLDHELNFTLTQRNHAHSESRRQGRYDGKFHVRIRVAENAFETQTANISMEGMLLQSPLPNWVPKYFTVELSLDGATIPLLCSSVKVDKGVPRVRVRIESNDNCEVLRRWLVTSAY